MLNRRTLVNLLALSALVRPALGAEGGILSGLKSAVDWFVNLVKEAPSALENVYDWLLRAKAGYRILFDSRAALNDIRRKLADPSTEEALQSKLRAWLKKHDQVVNEAQNPGESREDFVARQQKDLELLKANWETLRKDAVDALHEIGRLQDEIESVDPKALNAEEYRLFKSLLARKREEEEFLNIESPTDPAIIDQLREVAYKLDEIINVIAKNAPALDEAIKKAG